jgi:hypothetical protein
MSGVPHLRILDTSELGPSASWTMRVGGRRLLHGFSLERLEPLLQDDNLSSRARALASTY